MEYGTTSRKYIISLGQYRVVNITILKLVKMMIYNNILLLDASACTCVQYRILSVSRWIASHSQSQVMPVLHIEYSFRFLLLTFQLCRVGHYSGTHCETCLFSHIVAVLKQLIYFAVIMPLLLVSTATFITCDTLRYHLVLWFIVSCSHSLL